MTDNELLLAISCLMDKKLAPIERELKQLNITLENDILPRLQNIESCHTSTYNRYQSNSDRMEAAFTDIELMKKVLAEHSEKLQKIS
ncbi:hypothetical protein GPL15_13280 [Clostridium sp. MCC353]|uniref:hypothetical protein n=1 Tax=Clostridium sp. MCC353 TaxID=2592646 RepID=UPI001C034DEC|nr:hypothetical protein [Clostridium sp. MCC353]MBT9777477.1 hypothetical protein [Clostridium sp. MCC353]